MSMIDYNPEAPLPRRRRERRRGCPLHAATVACLLALLVIVAAGCTIDEEYGADGGWGTALQVDASPVDTVAPDAPPSSPGPWLFSSDDEIESRAMLRFEDALLQADVELDEDQRARLAEGEALLGLFDADRPIRHGDGVVESPFGLLEAIRDGIDALDVSEEERPLRLFEALVDAGFYDPEDSVHRVLKRRYLDHQAGKVSDSGDGGEAFGQRDAALEANACMTCLVSCKLDIGVVDKEFEKPDDRRRTKNDPGGRAGSRQVTCHQPPSAVSATPGRSLAKCGNRVRSEYRGVAKASWKGCDRELKTRLSCLFVGTPDGACDGLTFLASGHTDGALRLKSFADVPDGPWTGSQIAKASASGTVAISRFGNEDLLTWTRKSDASVEAPLDCEGKDPKLECDITLEAGATVSKGPNADAGAKCKVSTGFACEFTDAGKPALAQVNGRVKTLDGEVLITTNDWLAILGTMGVKLSHSAHAERSSGDPHVAKGESHGYARARIVFDSVTHAPQPAPPNGAEGAEPGVTVKVESVGRKTASLVCGACFGKGCKEEKPEVRKPIKPTLEPFECHQDADCDDGVACTVDRCNQDVCGCTNVPDDNLCEASGECFDATCDKTAGCSEAIVAGRACDDGSPCTVDDKCQEGFFGPGGCFGTSKLQVPVAEGGCARDGLGPCVSVACHEMSGECISDTASWDGETCDDGDPETQGERCRDGECKTCFCDEGYEVNEHEWYCDTEYDQSGRCLWDDEIPGTCKWVWDPCAEAGSCVNKAGCARCPEDPEAATIPACQPECIADSDCSDGDACNGEETCNTDTGTCALVTPPTCDDADECTVDWCDPIAGCQHTAVPGCGECSESDPSCGDPCAADPSLCPVPDPCATDPSRCSDPDPCAAKTEACEARYESWNFPVVDDGTGGCPPGACISSLEAFCAGETTGSSADLMGGVGVTVCTAEAPCELTNGVVFGGTPGRCPCPCEPLSDEP